MAILQISYSELSKASKQANKSARELENYSSSLATGIARKISSISGGVSGLTQNALDITNQKINKLNEKATKLYDFSKKIDAFKEKVKETDKSVSQTIKSESTIFAKNNNMKVGKVYAFFQGLLIEKLDKSELGRWVKATYYKAKNKFNDFKTELYHWYRTGGGKYIKDAVLSMVGVVAGVLGVIAAIASGGALIFIFAGVISSLFLVANGVNNIIQSKNAYKANKKGSPSQAEVYGNLDKASDTIRYHSKNHLVANILDLTEGAANVLCIFKSFGDVFKLLTEPGKTKGFVSLKKLFGSQKNKRSVGILGTKFTEKVGKSRNVTFNSLKNGIKTIVNDSSYRSEVGKCIKLFGQEVVDKAKYKKMTISQGKDLLKNTFKGSLEQKNRARSIFSSTIKNEINGRTYGIFKQKFMTIGGISDITSKISKQESLIEIGEFIFPNINTIISNITDLKDEINDTRENIVIN
ncbi:hypothetical protein [Clostridium sp.]|uniref:hypothetical protein n=1 Tax=Clostridium sp. TaxID=1506 RepID=UPI0025C45930|nr:hypothetical protein [Clostridium sp.]